MPDRYVGQDGQPRYGVRVSPEELEGIRREQGLDEPAAPRPTASWEDVDPYLRTGSQSSPRFGAVEGRGASGARTPRGAGASLPGYRPWRLDGDAAPPVRRGRWRLLVIGLVLLLVVPFALTAGAMAWAMGSVLTSSQPVSGGSGSVYLEAHTGVGVYRSDLTSAFSGCTVTDPAGAAVGTQSPEGLEQTYFTFTTNEAGSYTITCEAGSSSFVVGPQTDVGRIETASVVLRLALGCSLIGLVTSVMGIRRALRRR